MELEGILIDLLNVADLNVTRINDEKANNGVAYLIETMDAGGHGVIARLYAQSLAYGLETARNATVAYFNRRAWEEEMEEEE